MKLEGARKNRPIWADDEGRMLTQSVTTTMEHHTNHHEKEAYNVQFSQAPTASDDAIFYLVNSNDVDLVLEGITLYVSAAAEVYFKLGDKGTRNAATALTPTNLNSGSANAASGTFEKGADLDGGSATLTGGVEFDRLKFIAETASKHFNFNQDIIIPKNETLTMWSSTTATIRATLEFNYHNKAGDGN